MNADVLERADLFLAQCKTQAPACEIIRALAAEVRNCREWERRASASMDAACEAAGVGYCDAIPERLASLELELGLANDSVSELQRELFEANKGGRDAD